MTSSSRPFLVAQRSAVVLTVLLLAGCASTSAPFERSSPRGETSASLDQAAAEVAETNSRIEGALRALDDLVNHPTPDLRRQYETFATALNQLEASSARLTEATDAMKKHSQEYFVSWDRELATIRNEDLRDRTRERREEVAQRFAAIDNRYVEARGNLAPLVRRLNESKTALSMDLTPGGINSIRPTIGSLNDGAEPARSALNELAEELRQAGTALAPAANTDADGRSRN